MRNDRYPDHCADSADHNARAVGGPDRAGTFSSSSVMAMENTPSLESGTERHVVRLPARDDEPSVRVELLAGKTVRLDQMNAYFLSGHFEE